MGKDKFGQFETTPRAIWQDLRDAGCDGYDVMQTMVALGWTAVGSWGKDGWDLGSWPYVVVYWHDDCGGYELLTWVEGDLTQYTFPTKELRQDKTDEIAFFYWKHASEEWVSGFDSIDDVPKDSDLRGPVREGK